MEFFNLLSVTWLLLNSPSSPLGGDPSVNRYLLVESFYSHQRWLFAASHSPNSTRLLYSSTPVGFLQSFELISLCLFTRRELHLQTWRIEGLYLLRKLNGFKQNVRPISWTALHTPVCSWPWVPYPGRSGEQEEGGRLTAVFGGLQLQQDSNLSPLPLVHWWPSDCH